MQRCSTLRITLYILGGPAYIMYHKHPSSCGEVMFCKIFNSIVQAVCPHLGMAVSCCWHCASIMSSNVFSVGALTLKIYQIVHFKNLPINLTLFVGISSKKLLIRKIQYGICLNLQLVNYPSIARFPHTIHSSMNSYVAT